MKKQNGQAIAEYLILTALIAIASIGIIQVLSKNMRGKLDQINAAIIGEKKEFKGTQNTQRQTQMLDMGNFTGSMTDSSKGGESR